MCLAQGSQRSDAGEARTRGPSVSSQALYHWATALPHISLEKFRTLDKISCEEHSSLEIWDSPLFLSAIYQSKNHMIPNPGK